MIKYFRQINNSVHGENSILQNSICFLTKSLKLVNYSLLNKKEIMRNIHPSLFSLLALLFLVSGLLIIPAIYRTKTLRINTSYSPNVLTAYWRRKEKIYFQKASEKITNLNSILYFIFYFQRQIPLLRMNNTVKKSFELYKVSSE